MTKISGELHLFPMARNALFRRFDPFQLFISTDAHNEGH